MGNDLGIAERTGDVVCTSERWNARTLCGLTEAKATFKYEFEEQGRRPKERRRLETAVVSAVNYADIEILNSIFKAKASVRALGIVCLQE